MSVRKKIEEYLDQYQTNLWATSFDDVALEEYNMQDLSDDYNVILDVDRILVLNFTGSIDWFYFMVINHGDENLDQQPVFILQLDMGLVSVTGKNFKQFVEYVIDKEKTDAKYIDKEQLDEMVSWDIMKNDLSQFSDECKKVNTPKVVVVELNNE